MAELRGNKLDLSSLGSIHCNRWQAERAGVLDGGPEGRDWLAQARFTTAIRHRRHALTATQFQLNTDAGEMNQDERRTLEGARRRSLWALANIHPGDPTASKLLTILDELDHQEPRSASSTDKPCELNAVRDSVPVQHHQSGIDIVLEIDIPEPWRERFLQASIGSTRLPDGPYAVDWDKFLTTWEAEMEHLQQHRAARPKPRLD